MAPRSCLLLVEDDFALGETLGEALDDMGFDVVVACNGAQAIAELDAHAAEFEEVITDVDLGTGPDGLGCRPPSARVRRRYAGGLYERQQWRRMVVERCRGQRIHF
jgi:ActR/RegA family two-component response regulator